MAANELHEGTQYQSGCALLPRQDVTEIPGPVAYEPISLSSNSDNVIFDLETTALGDKAKIVQLAAPCLGKTFAAYILPTVPIQPSATDKTGLVNGQRKLMKAGKSLETVSVKEAVEKFLHWLNGLTSKSLVLSAHNCKS